MDIRNINDFNKKVSGSKINLIGQQAIKIYKKEIGRFKKYIEEEIASYYFNVEEGDNYKRTGNWLFSILESNIEFDIISNILVGTIHFTDEAIHPSIMKNGKSGYVPWLYEVGWQWKDDRYPRYHFTHYDGIQYMKKAVDKFYSNNPYKIKINVFFENEYGAPILYIENGEVVSNI